MDPAGFTLLKKFKYTLGAERTSVLISEGGRAPLGRRPKPSIYDFLIFCQSAEVPENFGLLACQRWK